MVLERFQPQTLCMKDENRYIHSRTIAAMMLSDMNLKSYPDTSYHNEELKSLTRYRFDKVKEKHS